MDLKNVTHVEQVIINRYQTKAYNLIIAQRLQLKILQTATKFYKWMLETGVDATFSAFCDDFGYDADYGEDRSIIYDAVLNIIQISRGVSCRE